MVEKQYPYLSQQGHRMITFEKSNQPTSNKTVRIGVSFNGRQSPGGHNIIYGLLS
jgi:hypothetical protein